MLKFVLHKGMSYYGDHMAYYRIKIKCILCKKNLDAIDYTIVGEWVYMDWERCEHHQKLPYYLPIFESVYLLSGWKGLENTIQSLNEESEANSLSIPK